MQIIQNTIKRNEDYEFVERKGIGHPDTMCDAIAECASQYYLQYFYSKYRKYAHYWFDKVMLIGGESNIEYGHGKLIQPYKVIFAGKCVHNFMGESVPLQEIFYKAASDVLSRSLTGFKADEHLVVVDETVDYQGPSRTSSRYRPMEVADLIASDDKRRVSNDCNMISAFYPLSTIESIVLNLEKYLNGSGFKENYPQVGSDIKIVGIRNKNNYNLLVNLPFVANYIGSFEEYTINTEKMKNVIFEFIRKEYGISCELLINPSNTENSPYLTVLGSAGDSGDVGVVGRGNRTNGLITPMRCMSIEAAAGKNSIDHTGKLYGILADRMAKEIYENLNVPVEIYIYVSKGTPLHTPNEVVVNVFGKKTNEEMEEKINEIIKTSLNSIYELTEELATIGITLW